MKIVFACCALLILTACSSEKKTAKSKINLDGTWIPVKQIIDGDPLPELSYQKQRLVIAGDAYTLTAESTDKGTLKYADGKMDIYGKEGPNKDKHIPAIYKLDDDQLTICYNLASDAYPESFETKGKKLQFLSVFRRAKK